MDYRKNAKYLEKHDNNIAIFFNTNVLHKFSSISGYDLLNKFS